MPAIDDYILKKRVGGKDFPYAGYISSKDITDLPPNVLVQGSINTYKKNTGVIANRPGKKLRGEVDASNFGTVSSYEWSNSKGRELPLRTTEEGILQVEVTSGEVGEESIIWHDLLTGLGENTDFVYVPWWWGAYFTQESDPVYVGSVNQDILIMSNGESNLKMWGGGIAEILSVGTANVITEITINDGGTGYTDGDILTITGGGGQDATVIISETLGVIDFLGNFTGGHGYINTTAAASTGGTGSGATFNIVVTSMSTLTKTGTESWKQVGFFDGQANSPSNYMPANTTLVINGVEYTYGNGGTLTTSNTGSTTTLYGVSPDASAVQPGDIAFQKVQTISDIVMNIYDETMEDLSFEADFIAIVKNQLAIGSYTSPVVYISSQSMFTDFVNAGSLITGDPDYLILDNPPTGMIGKKGSLYISAGNSDWYIATPNTPLPVSFTDFNIGGGARYVITQVDKRPGAALTAALSHNFIDSVGDDIIYLGQDHQIYNFGNFKNQFTTKFPSLSQAVKLEFEAEDFTGGALRSVGDYIYLTAPQGSGNTYIRQTRDDVDSQGDVVAERLWHPPQLWNISRIAVIDSITYGHSFNNPQVYQLWDTDQWHDDTPSGPQSYISHMTLSYWNFDRRDQLGSFDKMYVEGYIRENSDLRSLVNKDYLGATNIETAIISSLEISPFLFKSPGGSQIGQDEIGEAQIGGGASSEVMPKFRAIRLFELDNCFEYQIDIFSEEIDSRWEILIVGTNGEEVDDRTVFLQRTA